MAVKFYCCLLTGNLMLAASTALAVTDMHDRKSFIIPRTESPPTIDGTLDDDVWRNAAVIDDFHQTDPGDGLAPTENTIVRMTTCISPPTSATVIRTRFRRPR
jgi:hypothetical protein